MRRVMIRIAAVIAGAGLVFSIGSTAEAVPSATSVPVAAASSPNYPCGHAAPPDLDGAVAKVGPHAAQIRNGTSTACAAIGAAQPSDRLDVHCVYFAASSVWVFVRDSRTGVKGWVREDNFPISQIEKFSRACPRP